MVASVLDIRWFSGSNRPFFNLLLLKVGGRGDGWVAITAAMMRLAEIRVAIALASATVNDKGSAVASFVLLREVLLLSLPRAFGLPR